jgi:hypothetical protein
MHLSEMLMAAAITLSTAGVSYAALNTDQLTGRAETVADRVSCHTIDTAALAYAAQYGTDPTTIADLRPFVRGDISAYRIVHGLRTGPGCTAPQEAAPQKAASQKGRAGEDRADEDR